MFILVTDQCWWITDGWGSGWILRPHKSAPAISSGITSGFTGAAPNTRRFHWVSSLNAEAQINMFSAFVWVRDQSCCEFHLGGYGEFSSGCEFQFKIIEFGFHWTDQKKRCFSPQRKHKWVPFDANALNPNSWLIWNNLCSMHFCVKPHPSKFAQNRNSFTPCTHEAERPIWVNVPSVVAVVASWLWTAQDGRDAGTAVLFTKPVYFLDLMSCFVCLYRFFIESIAYLQQNATVELFYLQAKYSVYKVSTKSVTSRRQQYDVTTWRHRMTSQVWIRL